MDTTVDVEGLTKKFGHFTAVDHITFSVEKGEIFGFLGPNGAGKSTTIKMLCGILMPSGGKGHVAGFDIIKEQLRIKTIIGYMSQKFSLYDDLTISENLDFFGSIYGLKGKNLYKRIDAVLEMAEIKENRDTMVHSLPTGIKQRLALGGSILHDPPVLFLDEPTSGVDPIMRRNFWELIYQFSSEGKTVFVTTHYMDEAEHCDRIALVISGKIIALDSPNKLKDTLPYDVFSLKVERFIDVFDSVSRLDFIHEAAIFGSDIHVLCEKDFPLEIELDKILKQIGVNNYALDKIQATLEDVFVVNARQYSNNQ